MLETLALWGIVVFSAFSKELQETQKLNTLIVVAICCSVIILYIKSRSEKNRYLQIVSLLLIDNIFIMVFRIKQVNELAIAMAVTLIDRKSVV